MIAPECGNEQHQKRAKICDTNTPTTTFEKIQKLTAKQLANLYDRFPENVQDSLNKAEKGELEFVTSEDLEKITNNYLSSSPDKNELTTPLEGFVHTNFKEDNRNE